MSRADPPPRWHALSLPKHGHTEDEYEDAWAANPDAGRFAIADGASESAFAGLWARMLVEEFVALPQSPDFLRCLDAPRRRWSAAVMRLELPWYGEMKRAEGAFAALLALDVRPPTLDRPGFWRAAAVGDSCLVRVRKGRYLRPFPVKKSSDFGNDPRLVGSRDGLEVAPECSSGSLLAGDRLFLMTDSLAQWFLQAHERGGRPWETVEPLLSSACPEEAFAAWVEQARDGGDLRDDDVTLLAIELGLAPEE